MKKCKKCEIEKNEHQFNKWYKKTGATGYRTNCKQCESFNNKNFREQNKENLKIKRRERTGAKQKRYCTDPLQRKRNEDIYRSQRKYPEKAAARIFLNSYIRMGKIMKPDICEMCLKKIKIEGHHEDYSKPLEVKWVCKRCHANLHWNSKTKE